MCRCVDLICLLCACAQHCTCTLTKPAYWIYRSFPDWKPEDNRTLPASLPHRSVVVASPVATAPTCSRLVVLMETHQRSWKIDRSERDSRRKNKPGILCYCTAALLISSLLPFSALSHVSFPSCRKWRPKWSTACRRCCNSLHPTKVSPSEHICSFEGVLIHISGVCRYTLPDVEYSSCDESSTDT